MQDPLLSTRARRTEALPISWLMRAAVEDPQLISLAAGLVDRDSLPTEMLAELTASVLAEPDAARDACQYGTTEGYGPLRQAISNRYAAGTTYADADRILVTTGSQQALELLASACFDPGDVVIVEDPSYFVFTGVLASYGVEAVGVATDQDGMVVADLVTLLGQLEADGRLARLKAIYTVSYCQNPAGITLSAARRQALMQVVAGLPAHVLLIEDAAYYELVFDPATRPSLLLNFDPTGQRVATLMTASKPFAPGLKTGFAILPERLVGPLCNLKGNHDFGSNNFAQHLLARAIERGLFDQQIERLRAVYRRKATLLAEALRARLGPELLDWAEPSGGLYLWAEAPGCTSGPDSALLAACRDEHVLYVPGSYAYVSHRERGLPDNRLRLTYGVASDEQLVAGAGRLATAIEQVVAGS